MLTLINAVQWNKVGLVLGIIAGIAILLGIAILIVTKLCHINEDEKVLNILSNLAGANCGGCGHSGCEGFAKALAEGKAKLSDCKVTSDDAKKIICQINGTPFEAEEKTVAVVRCNGGNRALDKYSYVGNEGCLNRMVYHGGQKICQTSCIGGGTCEKRPRTNEYNGAKSCAVVASLYAGETGCAFGCLGLGDCVAACAFDAIRMNPETGLPEVDPFVACSSHCRGKQVTSFCSAGCIGCGLCSRVCPEKAITMDNFLPKIDYKKCSGCFTCVSRCPQKVIRVHTVKKSVSEKEPTSEKAAV